MLIFVLPFKLCVSRLFLFSVHFWPFLEKFQLYAFQLVYVYIIRLSLVRPQSNIMRDRFKFTEFCEICCQIRQAIFMNNSKLDMSWKEICHFNCGKNGAAFISIRLYLS